MAYVSEYGNWGREQVLMFSDEDLSQEQWETLDELPDYDKLAFVKSVLASNGN